MKTKLLIGAAILLTVLGCILLLRQPRAVAPASGDITGWPYSVETNLGDGTKRTDRITRCRNEQYNVEWVEVSYPKNPHKFNEKCVYEGYLKNAGN